MLITVLLFLVFFEVVFTEDSFIWGASTAAYQIEGGVGSRGRNIWDVYSHIPGKIYHDENGDVADDSYNRWEEDLDLLKELGVTHYRFSISWSRIYPTNNSIPDPAGIKYYSDVIDGCLKRGIKPLVTLYHWDLPDYLDWLDRDQVITSFVQYSRTCFEKFGDRVQYWLTFNEPLSFTVGGYGSGNAAPGRCSNRTICPEGNSSTEPYIVGHHTLLAHAFTYRMYEKEFKATQKGDVGITLNLDNLLPFRTTSKSDILAAEIGNEFRLAWFADCVYFGDYPENMKKRVGDRLPKFTSAESKMIKGTADFFGLNHYTTMYAMMDPSNNGEKVVGDWFTDQGIKTTYISPDGTPIGPKAASSWLYVYPPGIRQTLNWVSQRYDHPRIIVTENGVDAPGEDHESLEKIIDDKFRQDYITKYTEQLLLAKEKDKINVGGYCLWSVLDNFEWGDGYSKKFGITYIDRSNNLKRIKKNSFYVYQKIVQENLDL